MHRRNRYQREKLVQKIIVIGLIGSIVIAGAKARHILGKMGLINEGLTHYKEGLWIEAEESLQRAKGYKWFNYKPEELREALGDLIWITDYKDYMQDLNDRVTISRQEEDIDTFAQEVNEYEASNFQSLTETQKRYLLEKYPVDEVIHEGWGYFKAQVTHVLQNPLQGDYNWAKEKIFLIPEHYFTQDKETAIVELFKTSDKILYDHYMTNNGISGFRTFIDHLNDIYTQNKKYGFDTEWLTPQTKIFMYETMLQKSKEDLGAFSNYIRTYRREANIGYKDDNVEEVVTHFIEDKEKEIEGLLKAKEYDALIKLYKDLHYFKDYTKEIEVTEKMQKYDQPELLLEKPLEDYPFLQVGEGNFGADKYLVAINKTTNILELYLLIGIAQEYEVENYTISLSQLNIGIDELERIDVEENLIGLKGIWAQAGNVKYIVLRFENDGLNLAKSFEGESIELVDGIKHLRVTNPIDEDVLYTYDYILGEEGYEKQDIVATPISLSDTNLMAYIGQVVKLGCYIVEEAPDGKGNGYYYVGDTYYSDAMAYLYKENGETIHKGTYTIIGEMVGMEPYYSTSLNLEVLRPKIRIIEMTKE